MDIQSSSILPVLIPLVFGREVNLISPALWGYGDSPKQKYMAKA
ncbi:hypothetical protein [Lysinibacillus sphaericus]|nr:hypothetical protein [Lysinibacillus sphaericus]